MRVELAAAAAAVAVVFAATVAVINQTTLLNAKLFILFFRDACHDAWTNLRLSPMFGCICPNNHMKKRCDRIFNIVNHNPCVGKFSGNS